MELRQILIQNSRLPVISVRLENNSIEWNDEADAYFGISLIKSKGDKLKWFIKLVIDAIKTNKYTGTETCPFLKKRNQKLTYSITSGGDDTEAFYFISFFPIDITQKKVVKNTTPRTITHSFKNSFNFQTKEHNILSPSVNGYMDESEEKYRALVEQASEPFIINATDGSILEANEAACDLLGYSKDEYTKLNVRDLLIPAELKLRPILQNELLSGEVIKSNRTLVTKKGKRIPAHISSKLISDGRILVIARDMREWNTAQELLNDTAMKLQEAQRVAKMGSWTFDIQTNQLEWSDEIYRIFDVKRSDFHTSIETFESRIHPEDLEYVRKSYLDSVKNKVKYDINHRIIISDGSIKYVNEKCETFYDAQGQPLRSSGTVQDITERKLIDDSLAFKERQLDLIYNATSAIIYLIEVVDGRYKFISANKAGLIATGLRSEDFFNKYIDEVIPANSLAFIKEKYNEAIQNRCTINWEEETDYPAGKKTWIISITPVFETNGTCSRLVGTIQDVTEIKLASERILKEKELSDTIIKSLPGIFFLFNKEGKFLRWNQNFEEFSVYRKEELEKKTPLDLVEPEDKERIKKVIEYVFEKGSAEVEAGLLNKRGEIVPIYFTGWAGTFEGEPCIIGMGIDMTERKRVETELRDSEQKFNSLVNTIDGIVWEADVDTLKYTFVSQQAENLLGYSIKDWTDNASFWKEHLHQEDRQLVFEYFDQLKTGEKPGMLEFRMISASGKIIWLEDIVAVIYEDRKPKLFRGIMTDISDRKMSELIMKENNAKYTAVIDNSMNAFLLTNDQGDIIDTNATAREMFGYSHEDLKNMKTWQIFDSNYSKYADGVQQRKNTGRGKGEVYGLKKNGEKFPLAFTSSVFVNAEGKEMVSAIGIDISERVKYEDNLLKSNERFEKVSEATFDAIWDWDVKTHELYLGEGFKELFGYEVKNGSGEFSTWADHIHPDDRDEIVLSRLNKIIQYNDDKWRDEYRYIRADGSIAYVLDRGILLRENGLTYRMIGAMQDVTNSKLTEAELLKSNERFTYVSRATFDAIWDWDINTGELYWGEGFEQLFGHKMEGNKGDIDHWYDHIHADDRKRVTESLNKSLKDGSSNWNDDYKYLKADGSYAYVADKGVIIRNEAGQAYRMIGAMRDITPRKVAEEKLNLLNLELQQKAEQLSVSNAELESFAYVTSHDLQEPLRMVSSFLQLLQKKYENLLDEKGLKYINFAIDGSERMKVLIQDLLEFSRINSSREIHTEVDLNLICKKTLSNLRRVIDESHATINMLDLPTINGNESQLLQLFQNLIGNAIKYRSEINPVIDIGYKETTDEWEFHVKDNGIGIDAKFFTKIFVIFQRLHNRKEYEGTGIGLAICKKIVDFHGGKIWLESTIGEGTTFYFTISKYLI